MPCSDARPTERPNLPWELSEANKETGKWEVVAAFADPWLASKAAEMFERLNRTYRLRHCAC
jgi:hypothetical protein